jgi:hypothetical protein
MSVVGATRQDVPVEETRVEPLSRRRCVAGHDAPPSPALHPELGMVPSRTSTWFGAVVLLVIAGAVAWFAPGLRTWELAVLGLWWLATLLVQLALGHRATCLVRRTGRWFFGPVGALLDPVDAG